MKILVIDRDEIVTQMMTSRLSENGHSVVFEHVKSEGIERVSKDAFDVIFVDPSPMKDTRSIALNIRRYAKAKPYLIYLATDQETTTTHSVQMGCNDFILKPLNPEDMLLKVENAARLKKIFANLGDISEDFPNAGGIISKSAYNQICLSAMDRSGRYNELAYIMSISIDNYDEIRQLDGEYNANYCVSKMARHIVRMRRLSDIIGQTGKNEYSILLQRVDSEQEAIDAANRFAANFDEISDFLPAQGNELKININLTHLPTGASPYGYVLNKKFDTTAG